MEAFHVVELRAPGDRDRAVDGRDEHRWVIFESDCISSF